MKRLKQGTMVKVIWEDHCADSSKWQTNPNTHSICVITSIGWVAVDGKDYLTIAMNKQTDEATYGCFMTIIKSCITKIQKL